MQASRLRQSLPIYNKLFFFLIFIISLQLGNVCQACLSHTTATITLLMKYDFPVNGHSHSNKTGELCSVHLANESCRTELLPRLSLSPPSTSLMCSVTNVERGIWAVGNAWKCHFCWDMAVAVPTFTSREKKTIKLTSQEVAFDVQEDFSTGESEPG